LFTEKFHYKRPVFTKEAIDYLQKYAWPGNVRELQNMVERLVVLRNGSTVDLHDVVSLTDYNLQENPANKITLNIEQPLCEIEKQVILEVLKICKNKEEAAEKLGIRTTTIWRKLKNISK
jgi:transcriptional regulator with PAS, ATPase and Fis domain